MMGVDAFVSRRCVVVKGAASKQRVKRELILLQPLALAENNWVFLPTKIQAVLTIVNKWIYSELASQIQDP